MNCSGKYKEEDTPYDIAARRGTLPGQHGNQDEQVAACDPDDRLRATEGGFIMTDIADVESVAEPANNSKARSVLY